MFPFWKHLGRKHLGHTPVDLTFQVSEARKFLPKEELDNYAQLCQDKRLELELESFSDFEVF